MALHPGLWVVEFSNLGLVLGIVWNMTEKPGWGGAIAAVVIGYVAGAVVAVLLSRAPREELAAATG
jgi:tetrahydromethanopterin S-methyltransferase subunit C